jgi:hypothetical protein
MLDRINSVIHQRTRRAGLVSSFDKAHVGKRAEPHVARAAIQSKSVNPGPRAAWFNLQIETGTVVMQAGREHANLRFGELLNEARHEIPLWAVPTFHCVHTLHAEICYALSCDMDAMEKIFTGTLSAKPPEQCALWPIKAVVKAPIFGSVSL